MAPWNKEMDAVAESAAHATAAADAPTKDDALRRATCLRGSEVLSTNPSKPF